MSRVISVVIFGLVGAAFLSALGVWQLQRLAWKETVLAEIDGRIEATPVDLPMQVDRDVDRYLPVVVEGRFEGDAVRVLVSMQGAGPGYRVISAFEVEGRRVMVDRGFVSESVDLPAAPEGTVIIVGNLHWPDEVDGFTPEADLVRNIWYARDVEALSAHLQAEPVFIVTREISASDAPLTPLPVTADGIPNNHLGYAIQWFGLALVWLGMTAFLLWRITRRSV